MHDCCPCRKLVAFEVHHGLDFATRDYSFGAAGGTSRRIEAKTSSHARMARLSVNRGRQMGIGFSKCASYLVIGGIALVPFAAFSQESEGALQEVLVTAQKREQNLQVVPIAVTAVTGEDLALHNGYDIQQIAQLVPGLQFSLEGGDVNILMRGYPGIG